MDAPKCKICNERHYGPICPGLRGGKRESIPAADKASKLPNQPGPVNAVSRGATGKARVTTAATGKRPVAVVPTKSKRVKRVEVKPAGMKPLAADFVPQPEIVGTNILKAKRGRPRVEDAGKTIEAQKPWVAAKMSRASWYKRQAEKRGS